LKKVKKKQFNEKLKCNHYYYNERCHGESRSNNHSHSRHT